LRTKRSNPWNNEKKKRIASERIRLAVSAVFPEGKRGSCRGQISAQSSFEVSVGSHLDLILLHSNFYQIYSALNQGWQH
jgi:hypothetical protein